MEYLSSIILLVIIVVIMIKRYKDNGNVYNISERLKKLNKLNLKYNFSVYTKNLYKLTYEAKSKASLERITFDNIVIYHIENNITFIRTNIEKMISNNKMYQDYLKDYNNLITDIPIEKINDLKMTKEKFNKIEKRLMKKNKIKKNFNIIASIKATYTSPKGRNRYQKTIILKGTDLERLYQMWQQQKEFQISATFERSKMSDSLRYDVFKRDNFRCKICGVTADEGAKLHVDHIKPVSKGGKTVFNNLQTLCERCNIGKSNKF